MLYFTLAAKAYSRNLQYRGAHMVHNLASAMFGFIYASIWIGLGRDNPLGTYGTHGMISYICFTQSLLWITSFISTFLQPYVKPMLVLPLQIAQITAAIAKLQAAIDSAASRIGSCSIEMPPVTVPELPKLPEVPDLPSVEPPNLSGT